MPRLFNSVRKLLRKCQSVCEEKAQMEILHEAIRTENQYEGCQEQLKFVENEPFDHLGNFVKCAVQHGRNY